MPPSERLVLVDGEREILKVDVRLYTYRGNLILAAARLYQGQTTNFRTPGADSHSYLLNRTDIGRGFPTIVSRSGQAPIGSLGKRSLRQAQQNRPSYLFKFVVPVKPYYSEQVTCREVNQRFLSSKMRGIAMQPKTKH